MANRTLFSSKRGRSGSGPVADIKNQAGGKAYSLDAKHSLAQLVATGCLNGTFYANAQDQLDNILGLADKCDERFVAKVALYGRGVAHMKDTPALLVAWLAANGHTRLLDAVFHRVIDNGKMLRNFVQIIRSGQLGRKSFGTKPKRLIQQWLAKKTDEQVFRASVGNNPSLADIIKMAHPKAANRQRNALYAYLLGREHSRADLPQVIKDYEAFKSGDSKEAPKVDFQMLTSLPLTKQHWSKIAHDARWQMTRMNLNTFARHGVFESAELTRTIAERLADAEEVRKSKCFPYQLFTAYLNADASVPSQVKDALQDALEASVGNIQRYPGKVWVFPDVSGSMGSPATGYRGSASSKVDCRQVAALLTAAILRRNPDAGVLPFADRLFDEIRLNGRDTIMTNASKLAHLPGGGTCCSLPLQRLNDKGEKADLLIYVSDNQSWMDSGSWASDFYWMRHAPRSTSGQQEWVTFKKRNPNARMVLLNIQPYANTQVKEQQDSVLNIGGFSDVVFEVIAHFAEHGHDSKHWVDAIEEGIDLGLDL